MHAHHMAFGNVVETGLVDEPVELDYALVEFLDGLCRHEHLAELCVEGVAVFYLRVPV